MEFIIMAIETPILAKTLPEIDIDDVDDGDNTLPDAASIVLKLTPDACGLRLDKVLATLVPQYSRSRLQQWIESGRVTVDGEAGRTKMTVFGDENIVILPQAAPEEQAFRPEPMALAIMYEDASIA